MDSPFLVNSQGYVTTSPARVLGHFSHPPNFPHAHRIFFFSYTARATFIINLKTQMHGNSWCCPPFLTRDPDSPLRGPLQAQNVTRLHSAGERV